MQNSQAAILLKCRIDRQSLIRGIRRTTFSHLRKAAGTTTTIGGILQYEQPQAYIATDTEYTSNGIPVLTANKAFILGYTNENFGIYDKGDCVIFDDFTLDCKYVNFPFKVKSSAIKILTSKNRLLLRYAFEYLKYLCLSTDEHKRHYIAETQYLPIPLAEHYTTEKVSSMFEILSTRMDIAYKTMKVYEEQKLYLLRQMFI